MRIEVVASNGRPVSGAGLIAVVVGGQARPVQLSEPSLAVPRKISRPPPENDSRAEPVVAARSPMPHVQTPRHKPHVQTRGPQ